MEIRKSFAAKLYGLKIQIAGFLERVIMYEFKEEWLDGINQGFSKNDIPHKQRPWLACCEWSKYTGISIPMNGEIAKRIFAWFDKNTKVGSQMIGSMYTGGFYYDACFWPIYIPIIYGTVKINPRDSFKTMPETILARLWCDREKLHEYIAVWSDCCDYAFGLDEILKSSTLVEFAQNLLKSGNQQLNATISLLLEQTPNPKAMETARMSTEMFLKAYLVTNVGLTENDAKDKFGHNLEKTLKACLTVDPKSELHIVEHNLQVFPNIGDRYKGTDKSPKELWIAYGIAQSVGTTVVRSVSGRDVRKTIKVD